MNDFLKGALVILMLIYIISPVDLAPGIIDDILVAVLGIAAEITLSKNG